MSETLNSFKTLFLQLKILHPFSAISFGINLFEQNTMSHLILILFLTSSSKLEGNFSLSEIATDIFSVSISKIN